LACRQVLLSHEWLIATYPNMRFFLESSAAQRVWVSQQALIIDDYGHWQGARKAVDEYLGSLSSEYFLHRIDYTGRLLIKL